MPRVSAPAKTNPIREGASHALPWIPVRVGPLAELFTADARAEKQTTGELRT